MANMCFIQIKIPLAKVSDKKEREQLMALYNAEKKWDVAVKDNDELRRGINREVFLASQPGVLFKRTQYKYYLSDEAVKKGMAKEGELKPDSEQYNYPIISASFEEVNGEIWVRPYTFGRGKGLLFDEDDGISLRVSKPNKEVVAYPNFVYIPMSWDFKHGFPWWAEIGFAGGKKEFTEGEDAPDGQTNEFYEKWYEEHGEPYPYLVWKQSVSRVLKNLEYAIKVYENFPLVGLVWQMTWIWKELRKLVDIYKWLKQISFVSTESKAELDWSEVASYSGEYAWTKRNDSPNQIMSSIKQMEVDTNSFNKGELPAKSFKKMYASKLRWNEDDYKGYVPVANRDPFYYLEWL